MNRELQILLPHPCRWPVVSGRDGEIPPRALVVADAVFPGPGPLEPAPGSRITSRASWPMPRSACE